MAENEFVSREISVSNGRSIRISINIPFKIDEMEWKVDFTFSELLASKSGYALGVDAFGAIINALSKIRYILNNYFDEHKEDFVEWHLIPFIAPTLDHRFDQYVESMVRPFFSKYLELGDTDERIEKNSD